jgi:peptidoglycan/LPS O-acetylase OafA/YrhL
MRRRVPLFITLCVGLLLIFAVFLPPIENSEEHANIWFDIIAVFAFFLGGGNLLRVHANKLRRRQRDWGFSIVTIIGFLAMLVIGLFKLGNPGDIKTAVDAPGSLFYGIFQTILVPLQSTMYSLLAFFVASASYRAFRAKNREATLLLIAAFIILLGRTPFGTLVTGWIPDSFSLLQIPNLAIWIMNSPNLAGQRAIMIGIGLGVISMSLRLILGLERSYLGDDSA